MGDATHGMAGVLMFSIYLIVYLGILMAHLIALTLSNRHNFYLVVRGRLMLSLELILNGVISAAIALRQIFKDAGWEWPCSLSTFAMTLTFTAYIGTYLLRALVLITIFDQRWRSKYRVLLTTRSLLGLWSITFVGGIIAWGIVNGRQLCHSHLCTQPNCYMGSNYYFALCYNQVALSTMTLAALKLRNLRIDERLGIRTELLNCVRASGMLVIPYYVIVIMQDWGHALDWYYDWICTASGLAIFLSQFVFTQFFPSYRYGYSPWSRRVIRDSREAYRNMFKAAVSGGFMSPKSQASMKRLDDDTRTMQDIVGHETLRGALARFCRSCLCEELALFVIRMHTYARVLAEEPTGYKSERAARLRKDLVKRFIREGAVYELNAAIPPDLRDQVLSARLRILRATRPPLLSRLLLGRVTTDPLPHAVRYLLPLGLLRRDTRDVTRQMTLPIMDPEVESSTGGGRTSDCSAGSDPGLPPMRHGGSFFSSHGTSQSSGLGQSVGLNQSSGLGQSADDITEPLEELNTIVLDILTNNIMDAFKSSRPYIKALEAYTQAQEEKADKQAASNPVSGNSPQRSSASNANPSKRDSAPEGPSPVRVATVS